MKPLRSPFAEIRGAAAAAGAEGTSADAIPPLRPPRGQLRPGFWGRYAWWILGAMLPLCLGIAVLWCLRRRSYREAERLPAEAVARHALEVLRPRAEDNALLADVVRVLRRYYVQTLPLPEEEPTTLELCRALRTSGQRGAEVAEAAATFLEMCEQRRFDGGHLPDPGSIVETALALVDRDVRERTRRADSRAANSGESGG